MLIEHETFTAETGPPRGRLWNEGIFRWCNFVQLEIELPMVGGAMIGCALREVDWYWGLFNTVLLSHTTFKSCVFRGMSFAECEFIACRFEDCRFVLNNLQGPCRFSNCIVVETAFDRCEFVVDNPRCTPVFVETRFYGCTQAECSGLAGVV
ncbi:pentapeptide repeat-containing protein [Bradyrhizobium sp. SRS-191]|uniref:pentapeptide repeat-containing protein n=1 Tax=Bradyrhizobium sp. SRS-191 TaxID=2962606 RepID=UPI00211F1C10|nr:pentapeptide repeat-containing protein [Bradyrhizobium sp. SRS-191]